MYLVTIAWIYVAAMMAAAEATNPNGTVLGAVFTFLLYGVMPLAVVLYVMATPQRRRMRGEAMLGDQGGRSVQDRVPYLAPVGLDRVHPEPRHALKHTS